MRSRLFLDSLFVSFCTLAISVPYACGTKPLLGIVQTGAPWIRVSIKLINSHSKNAVILL
jgi:hypothetical protein